MKKLFTLFITILLLAPAAIAAPNFNSNINPELNFLVARVLNNNNEITLATFAYTGTSEDDAIIRAITQEAARQNRTNNPAWRIVIYCPTNSPVEWYTNGDRCWDSATDL